MTTTEEKNEPKPDVPLESEMEPPPLDPVVAQYRGFFNKPVAVQLTGPYISIECCYDEQDGRQLPLVTEGVGLPKLGLREGKPEALVVLTGALRPSGCGPKLLFTHRTQPHGALAEILLDPKYIFTVTAIVGPVAPPEQPEPNRIIAAN